jgi:hypothetical protein
MHSVSTKITLKLRKKIAAAMNSRARLMLANYSGVNIQYESIEPEPRSARNQPERGKQQ